MLEVDMKTTIKTLYQKGYNKTQIGRMLGIDRKTVRKVLKDDANQKETGQGTQESVWPSMLDEYPNLRKMDDEHDDNTQVFYFRNATAVFFSFDKKPEEIKL